MHRAEVLPRIVPETGEPGSISAELERGSPFCNPVIVKLPHLASGNDVPEVNRASRVRTLAHGQLEGAPGCQSSPIRTERHLHDAPGRADERADPPAAGDLTELD